MGRAFDLVSDQLLLRLEDLLAVLERACDHLRPVDLWLLSWLGAASLVGWLANLNLILLASLICALTAHIPTGLVIVILSGVHTFFAEAVVASDLSRASAGTMALSDVSCKLLENFEASPASFSLARESVGVSEAGKIDLCHCS